MKKNLFLKNALKRILLFIKIYNTCTDNIDFINNFIDSNINVLQAAIIIFILVFIFISFYNNIIKPKMDKHKRSSSTKVIYLFKKITAPYRYYKACNSVCNFINTVTGLTIPFWLPIILAFIILVFSIVYKWYKNKK